ncbi:unnamed protein product [Ilex paraguariensis]|uniref:Transposase n=1 Tax=Ilex paraguariensis TaxID=185542 RepID=A0ABC8S9Y9_9AQUA
MSSKLVANLIVDRVHGHRKTRPTEVVADFFSDYGLTISYDKAWEGVEKAKDMLFGDQSVSCQQLRWYVNAANCTNPGNHIVLDCDHETNCFKKLFVSFKGCIHGFNYCHSLFFFWMTHF